MARCAHRRAGEQSRGQCGSTDPASAPDRGSGHCACSKTPMSRPVRPLAYQFARLPARPTRHHPWRPGRLFRPVARYSDQSHRRQTGRNLSTARTKTAPRQGPVISRSCREKRSRALPSFGFGWIPWFIIAGCRRTDAACLQRTSRSIGARRPGQIAGWFFFPDARLR